MEVVLRAQYSSLNGVAFQLKHALIDEGSLLVPTLLTGTMEVLEEWGGKNKKHLNSSSGEKRDWEAMAFAYFDKLDKIDVEERARERRRHRSTRTEQVDSERSGIFDSEEMFWA